MVIKAVLKDVRCQMWACAAADVMWLYQSFSSLWWWAGSLFPPRLSVHHLRWFRFYCAHLDKGGRERMSWSLLLYFIYISCSCFPLLVDLSQEKQFVEINPSSSLSSLLCARIAELGVRPSDVYVLRLVVQVLRTASSWTCCSPTRFLWRKSSSGPSWSTNTSITTSSCKLDSKRWELTK